MNKDRRKAIAKITDQLDELRGMMDNIRQAIEDIKDEEQEYHDNMPEAFQQGEKGDAAQTAIDALDNAAMEFDNLNLDDITSYLDEAAGV